ncbi:MAG: hypothetical protein KA479_05100 [Saprospiraceae bacterium]|nr:hypothetical protein [Saprospiraceae bacterium]
MKKFITACAMALLVLATTATSMQGAVIAKESNVPSPKPTPSPEAQVIMSRLDVIKSMDKSEMSSLEKKELRNETRNLKKELKRANGGIYFSAGAIIVIIILLIILL